jgi:hypothetical protein
VYGSGQGAMSRALAWFSNALKLRVGLR